MPPQLKLPIYLDYQATTPLDPRVLEAMTPYFTEFFGNAASKNHAFGRAARLGVESARETIAKSINARPQDICFTSGATESVNLAIKGLFSSLGKNPQHFITVVTEHPAVLDSFRRIKSEGAEVTYLLVDAQGMIDPQQIANAIRPHTKMVSVMAANNEIGVIQPLQEIGAICRRHNLFFMTDATQAFGQMPLDVLSVEIFICLLVRRTKFTVPKAWAPFIIREQIPKFHSCP